MHQIATLTSDYEVGEFDDFLALIAVRSEGIEPLGPTRILMDLLDELSEYAEQAETGNLSEKDREKAVEREKRG